MFQPCHVNQLQRMHIMADRTRAMIHARAVQAYCQAFGGKYTRESQLDMCVIHNSLVSFENGKPWAEVNYSQMRRARWLCEKAFEPNRLVTAWYQRKSKELRA